MMEAESLTGGLPCRRSRPLKPSVFSRGSAVYLSRVRLELIVSGMLAVHAKHAVFAALAGVAGVTRAEVELGRADLEVERREGEFEALAEELRTAIDAVGYVVTEIRRLPRHLPTL